MVWLGWLLAAALAIVAVVLYRHLARERSECARLRIARIEAESREQQLESRQVHAFQAAARSSFGNLTATAMQQMRVPAESAKAAIAGAGRKLDEYRDLVRRYDAAVQYCLQPVELIFGADKATIDDLVQHVEGARRKLFEARAALESTDALDGAKDFLGGASKDLDRSTRIGGALEPYASDSGIAVTDVDVNALLDDAVALLAPRLSDRIRVTREYEPLPPLHDRPRELGTIFLHLIGNAIQAMHGQGTLMLTTRTTGPNGVEVLVADSGIGIVDDNLPRIFEPFFTTRPTEESNGVGLTVVHHLVNDRGGSVKVQTVPGRGSTFTVTLPFRSATGTTPAPARVPRVQHA
ncbi:MAG: ATP-binding protein [Lysobacterales bacterium]